MRVMHRSGSVATLFESERVEEGVFVGWMGMDGKGYHFGRMVSEWNGMAIRIGIGIY